MLASEMVVLERGDLAVAMRASMSIPGVFAPVTIDGKVLSDGGIVRNLPVDVARELCADVVIAVWMSSPSLKASNLSSAFTMLERSLGVAVEANERAQIATLTAVDVPIQVEMGDIGSADFQRVADAIKLGRAAAEKQRDSLLRYSVPEDEYAAWARSVGRTDVLAYTLADVRISGTDRVNPEYVAGQLKASAAGTTVTPEEVSADVERIYDIGDFERVDYRLVGEGAQRDLEIDVAEKSWGPNRVHADFGFATNEGGDIFAIVRVDHDRAWINAHGGRWHSALQIGRESIATTDFYQPLDTPQRFFVQPIAFAGDRLEDLYIDGHRIGRFHVRQLYGQVDLGANFGTTAQVRLGLRSGSEEANVDTGLFLSELPPQKDTSLQAAFVYDTRDSVGQPTRGSFVKARYVLSRDWLGGDQDYSLIESVFSKAFPVRERNSLSLIVGGADTLYGNVPVTQDIQLGGIRTFPGLRPGELRGERYWFVGTS
jgi:NTE family protein